MLMVVGSPMIVKTRPVQDLQRKLSAINQSLTAYANAIASCEYNGKLLPNLETEIVGLQSDIETLEKEIKKITPEIDNVKEGLLKALAEEDSNTLLHLSNKMASLVNGKTLLLEKLQAKKGSFEIARTVLETTKKNNTGDDINDLKAKYEAALARREKLLLLIQSFLRNRNEY
jgi:hypothetical protein